MTTQDKAVADQEFVVTEAMIEAGVTELLGWRHDWDCKRQTVHAVFTAMLNSKSDQ